MHIIHNDMFTSLYNLCKKFCKYLSFSKPQIRLNLLTIICMYFHEIARNYTHATLYCKKHDTICLHVHDKSFPES